MRLSNADKQRRYRVRQAVKAAYPGAVEVDVIALRQGRYVCIFDPATGEKIGAVKA